MRYLTFALAKGRLAKKTLALLEQIGITCEEMKDPDTRKLIFVNEELKMKFFLSKATDVPTYVEYGAADIGVVGKDTILEEGRNLYEVMDLGFGKCRMCEYNTGAVFRTDERCGKKLAAHKKTLSLFERETSGEIVVIIETKAGRYDQCRNEFLYINNF